MERLAPAVRVLNLELATSAEIVALACRLRPLPGHARSRAPGGDHHRRRARPAAGRTPGCARRIRRLDEAGIRVSLFIDPDPAALDAAKDLGVPAVELHTGRYAHTWRDERRGARGAAPGRAPRRRHGTLRPRRPRPHLPERRAGRRDSRDRGAQHRAQHREPRRDGGHATARWRRWLHLVQGRPRSDTLLGHDQSPRGRGLLRPRGRRVSRPARDAGRPARRRRPPRSSSAPAGCSAARR